jgi:hypothetical protein
VSMVAQAIGYWMRVFPGGHFHLSSPVTRGVRVADAPVGAPPQKAAMGTLQPVVAVSLTDRFRCILESTLGYPDSRRSHSVLVRL